MEKVFKDHIDRFTREVFAVYLKERMGFTIASEYCKNTDTNINELLIKCVESDGLVDPDELLDSIPEYFIDDDCVDHSLDGFFDDYVVPKKIRDKILNKNKNKIYGKLIRLTEELWKRHGIVFLNFTDEIDARCMLEEIRESSEPEPLGVIGWQTQNTILWNHDSALLWSFWRCEDEDGNETEGKTKDNLKKYVRPLMNEICISRDEIKVGGRLSIEIAFDGFDLPNLVPNDFIE